ncbi:MAG: sigma-70 family RNA polymerase sigma factor [Ruminococcaceae bacterium]|nr:sigma-70 family RNA polymerase sigma factor [Oscillospiraceae bacterium]
MREPTTRAELEAARQGGDAELAAIITRFMPAIRRVARRAAGPGLDFDDAVQEGLIGLFFAIQNWREGRGAAFNTYAITCIQNAVLSARRAAGRKKHAPLNQSVPLGDAPAVPGPEDAAIANEQVGLALARARTLLSPLEKTILRLYLDGLSYREIALRIGKTPKTVDNALARVRRKLK